MTLERVKKSMSISAPILNSTTAVLKPTLVNECYNEEEPAVLLPSSNVTVNSASGPMVEVKEHKGVDGATSVILINELKESFNNSAELALQKNPKESLAKNNEGNDEVDYFSADE